MSYKNKILGLQWDKFEDNFVFDFTEIREKFDVIPTKRNVIKAIASIYDPLGLLNPIVVQMKTFFQRLCSAKYGWDDLITNDYLEEWNELVKSLSAIEFISVPRLYCYYNSNDPIVTIELHGFCDVSMKAYGCCVYLRFVHRSKFVKVVLVTSKSRIAPLRKQSIPKLELLSCLLLVRLINTLKKEFKNFYDILNFYLWTDSSVAYSWIVNTSKVFPVFIQNRLKEIRNLVDVDRFKLIDTKRNRKILFHVRLNLRNCCQVDYGLVVLNS